MNLRHITTSRSISTIETLDGAERRILPARSVRRGNGDSCEVDEVEWERGIQLEIGLSEVVVSVERLTAAFHKRGLWSSADIAARPRDARAALTDVCSEVVMSIIEAQKAGG